MHSCDVVPDRVLLVSPTWPAGVDLAKHFTSIASALATASVLTPTHANPVLVMIFPGTYNEPLTLVSNVHLVAQSRASVFVTGSINWTPGVGVNAAQATVDEEIDLVHLRLEGAITIDATGKIDSTSRTAIDWRNVNMRGSLTMKSRGGRIDFFQAWDSQMSGDAVSFDNTIVNLFDGTYGAGQPFTFSGAADIEIDGNQMFSPMTMSGSVTGRVAGLQIVAPVVIGAGCSIDFTGSRFEPGATLTVESGGSADVRSAEYGSLAQLIGPGTIDRSIWRTAATTTSPGSFGVAIDPPYPNADYGVTFELQSPGAVYPSVVSKSGGSLTINDPIGGQTFGVIITKE